MKFVQSDFDDKYDPTIEDSYKKQIEVDDKVVMLDILDIATSEEYLRDQYIRTGYLFIVMYSINDSSSLKSLESIVDQIYRVF
jgi:GTPase SAR1 family protein